MSIKRILPGAVLALMLAATAFAQSVPAPGAPDTVGGQAGNGGRGGGRGGSGEGRGGGIGSSENAPLIFEEHWTRAPQAEPILQANLGNRELTLHTYGDTEHIRKTFHPVEDYTYTGETLTNWALTVSDPKNYWDLSGTGKIMLRTRNSGFRVTHIVLKTKDGKYFASEEGSPDSSAWMNRDYILQDLHWRNLLMTDTPSNPITVRKPDPKIVPVIPQDIGHPDLTKVEEAGFSDLMPGGWIPSTTRVNAWALYGKKVPR